MEKKRNHTLIFMTDRKKSTPKKTNSMKVFEGSHFFHISLEKISLHTGKYEMSYIVNETDNYNHCISKRFLRCYKKIKSPNKYQ